MLAASEGTSRAAFNKLVEDSNADRDPLSNETRRVFWNYLEYWEHLQTQDDDLTAWLRQKYVGMRLLDEVDDGENETRHIYDIIFHTRRPQGLPRLDGPGQVQRQRRQVQRCCARLRDPPPPQSYPSRPQPQISLRGRCRYLRRRLILLSCLRPLLL